MAKANHAYTTSQFHNLSNEALADTLGHADAVLKGAEAECKSLKDEFKHRGLAEVSGENSRGGKYAIAPRARRPLRSAAITVVPEPRNGTSIVAPGGPARLSIVLEHTSI